ncbi:hypothetical protein, partial [Streptomyces sp. NPDC001999]
KAFFGPASSRYKIYIIDEAHMVTSAGFNALLTKCRGPQAHCTQHRLGPRHTAPDRPSVDGHCLCRTPRLVG